MFIFSVLCSIIHVYLVMCSSTYPCSLFGTKLMLCTTKFTDMGIFTVHGHVCLIQTEHLSGNATSSVQKPPYLSFDFYSAPQRHVCSPGRIGVSRSETPGSGEPFPLFPHDWSISICAENYDCEVCVYVLMLCISCTEHTGSSSGVFVRDLLIYIIIFCFKLFSLCAVLHLFIYLCIEYWLLCGGNGFSKLPWLKNQWIVIISCHLMTLLSLLVRFLIC